jgi:hypothetical protein
MKKKLYVITRRGEMWLERADNHAEAAKEFAEFTFNSAAEIDIEVFDSNNVMKKYFIEATRKIEFQISEIS